MDLTNYPKPKRILQFNLLVLGKVAEKVSAPAQELRLKKIAFALVDCKHAEGDIYDKAVCLLRGLIERGPFSIANSRIAFLVTRDFLASNGVRCPVEDDPRQPRMLRRIELRACSDETIRHWLMTGKIKETER